MDQQPLSHPQKYDMLRGVASMAVLLGHSAGVHEKVTWVGKRDRADRW
jgi:hypothetical protein